MNHATVTMRDDDDLALTAMLNLLDEVYECVGQMPEQKSTYMVLLGLRNRYRIAKRQDVGK